MAKRNNKSNIEYGMASPSSKIGKPNKKTKRHWIEQHNFLRKLGIPSRNVWCGVAIIPKHLLDWDKDDLNVNTTKKLLAIIKNKINVREIHHEAGLPNQVPCAVGSGTLIGPKHILTAKHVLASEKGTDGELVTYGVDDVYFILGFEYYAYNRVDHSFQPWQICEGVSIVDGEAGAREDWAVVELKESVLKNSDKQWYFPRLDLEKELTEGEELYMIGHPLGLPKKLTYGGKVVNPKATHKLFSTDLDSFAGNSGSPVFRVSNNKMVGILKGGFQNFWKYGDTLYLKTYPDGTGTEVCQSLIAIRDRISQINY